MSHNEPQDRWIDRVKAVLGLAEPTSMREELESALKSEEVAAEFSVQERTLLVNLLHMRATRVADVMTPRVRVIGVSETATLGEVLAVFRETSHARMPIYGETADDPKGMIHIRDLLAYLGGDGVPFADIAERLSVRLADVPLARPVLFAPPSVPALDLLVRMQAKRVHMALVINEYGETDGIVTMEDLVEAIVGEIEDEHDTPEPPAIEVLEDGSLVAAGDVALEDVEARLGFRVDHEASGIMIDSIGGFVVALAGRVPQVGETVTGPSDLTFEIAEADPRRIRRLIIRRPAGLTGDAGRVADSASMIIRGAGS